jgi:hypothetical protein
MSTRSASVIGDSGAELTFAFCRNVLEFLPQDGRVDLQTLRDVGCEFVAHDAARDALHMRQQEVHCLDFSFWSSHGKRRTCALNEVVEIFL